MIDDGREDLQTNEDGVEPRYDGSSDLNRRKLERAGWELIEKDSEKILWRNPESGRLYPESAVVKLMREGQVPEDSDET